MKRFLCVVFLVMAMFVFASTAFSVESDDVIITNENGTALPIDEG